MKEDEKVININEFNTSCLSQEIQNENILTIIDNIDENIKILSTENLEIKEDIIQTNQSDENEFINEIIDLNQKRQKGILYKFFNYNIFGKKIKFLGYYIFVSTITFLILLGITNYSAYSKILYSYINPYYLKNSSNEILTTINESKIKVYAQDDIDISEELRKEEEQRLSQKLKEENNLLKETFFSPKKLVSLNSQVSIDLEVVPYENRIVIPKIGKNVPLVNVDIRREFNVDNLENIFMKELEKGVVRYPGTTIPGEEGNVFIFGHSSNYPWIKGDYNDVFALLDNLSFGDEIIIYYNQKKYTYIIKEKKSIKPGDVKILNREEGKKELTLMTCWPIGTTYRRLLVIGELKKEAIISESKQEVSINLPTS